MRRWTRISHSVFPLLLSAVLMTGCHPAMSTRAERILPPPETLAVPLRFARHDFEAHCYNTVSCKVVYDNFDFTPYFVDKPAPAPSGPNYKDAWDGASYIGIRNFPPPAKVHWKSLDGVSHETTVNIASIFTDELAWHRVPKADMADFFRGPVAGEPDIFLEVNDRTINVYTKMFVPTRTEQIPGNKHSNARDDLFLVWTQTY